MLLPRAIDWFEVASENPRMLDKARAILRLGLAKLYAYAGRIDEAVEAAEAAVRTDPGQVHFLFELTALYLTLDDLDAAERTLAVSRGEARRFRVSQRRPARPPGEPRAGAR